MLLRAHWLPEDLLTCYHRRVPLRAHWLSEDFVSRFHSRRRFLSDRRFREDSLADLHQQMVQHHLQRIGVRGGRSAQLLSCSGGGGFGEMCRFLGGCGEMWLHVLECSTRRRCKTPINICRFHARNLLFSAMAELKSCLPGSSVAADATRLSAGCWEGTMNLKLGRPVGSTVSEVSPFVGPGEQV